VADLFSMGKYFVRHDRLGCSEFSIQNSDFPLLSSHAVLVFGLYSLLFTLTRHGGNNLSPFFPAMIKEPRSP
jgi:hypothetical protein